MAHDSLLRKLAAAVIASPSLVAARPKSVVVALGWGLTAAMLDASDVFVVLDQLDQAGLVVWLDGGWGVDALLGHQGRPHEDLGLGHRPRRLRGGRSSAGWPGVPA